MTNYILDEYDNVNEAQAKLMKLKEVFHRWKDGLFHKTGLSMQ